MFPQFATRFLLIIFAIAAVWGLLLDLKNTSSGGALDLRNRMTGARTAAAGIDPFTYKWKTGQKETFCDVYNHAGWPMSKVTVTPLVLALHIPFRDWSYKHIQWLWFLVQYGALALGFLGWSRAAPPAVRMMGAVLTLAFCGSAAWRLHVDRGQIYVIYAAALLLLAWLGTKRGRAWNLFEGFSGALLMGMRPVIFTEFSRAFFRRQWIAFTGAAVGLAFAVGVPMLIFGYGIIPEYKKGMERHAELYLEQSIPIRAAIAYPPTVEGIPIDELARFAKIPFADTSVYNLVSYKLPPKAILIVWALLTVAAGWAMKRRSAVTDTAVCWALSAWVALGDFLLPAFRNTYNDVLFWPLLLFGLTALKGRARALWNGCSLIWVVLEVSVWVMPKGLIPIPSILGFFLAVGVAAYTLLPQSSASLTKA